MIINHKLLVKIGEIFSKWKSRREFKKEHEYLYTHKTDGFNNKGNPLAKEVIDVKNWKDSNGF